MFQTKHNKGYRGCTYNRGNVWQLWQLIEDTKHIFFSNRITGIHWYIRV